MSGFPRIMDHSGETGKCLAICGECMSRLILGQQNILGLIDIIWDRTYNETGNAEI